MLFTTENWILIKHYRLDKNMAEGKYALISKQTLVSKWTRQTNQKD